MASRDIDLVIRAKNEATKAIDSVVDALKDLAGVQEDVGKSASKNSNLINQLGAEIGDFSKQMQGLAGLGKIAQQLDRATSAINRMETAVAGTENELSDLNKSVEKVASSTTALQAQATATAAALDAQKTATRQAREEQVKANRELRSAETALENYKKKAIEAQKIPGSFSSTARASAGTLLQGDVDAARQARDLAAANVAAQQGQQTTLRKALVQVNNELEQSVRAQDRLGRQVEETTASLGQMRADLETAKGGLNDIQKVATQASEKLGGVAATQEAVAKASARMAAELAAGQARLAAIAKAPAPTQIDTSGMSEDALRRQRRLLLETKRDWTEAQEAVKRLAIEFRNAQAPTAEMGTALGQAQAKAKITKDAYEALRETLSRVNSTAQQTTFKTFSQAQTAGISQAASAQNALAAAAANAAAAQRTIAPAAGQAGTALGNTAGKTNALKEAFAGLYGESRKSMSLLQRIRGEVLALATAYVGLQAGIGQIGEATKAYQTLEAAQSRLGAVFNQDQSQVQGTLRFLNQQADRLGISFDVLADEYGKFAIAAAEANFTSEDTRKIFLSVAEAARVNKLSQDQMQGTFLALQQMISKGKVSSEELRRQMGDRLPGAFNIFAKAIGVTTAQLDEMLKAGEVVADRDTLLSFADQLNERFGPQLSASLDSITADIGKFRNAVFNARLDFSGGFIGGLRDGLQELTTFFRSDEGVTFFRNLGRGVGELIGVLAQLPQYFSAITTALQAFVAIKVGNFLATLGSGLVASGKSLLSFQTSVNAAGVAVTTFAGKQSLLTRGAAQIIGAIDRQRAAIATMATATRTASAGLTAFSGVLAGLRVGVLALTGLVRGLWAALGGLPGIVLSGIVYAVTSWTTGVDEATTALDTHDKILNALRDDYEKTAGSAKKFADEVKGASLAQAVTNLNNLQEKLREVRSEVSIAGLGEALGGNREQFALVRNLTKEFAAGNLSAQAYKDSLDDIVKVNPGFREFAVTLQETADKARTLETAIKQADAAVKYVAGTANDADREILGLKKATEGTDEAARNAASNGWTKYNDALDELKSKIPSLRDELERLKASMEINTAGITAMAEALKQGNVGKFFEAVGTYVQAGVAVNEELLQKALKEIDSSGKVTLDIVRMLKGEEGYRSNAYLDSGGTPTIGFGSTRVNGRAVQMGDSITEEDAYKQLVRDIAEFGKAVDDLVKVPITENMRKALLSYAYNAGPNALKRDGILGPLNKGDYAGAAAAIRGGVTTANGIPVAGLSARRQREGQMFETGLNDPTVMAEAARLQEERVAKEQELTAELRQQSAERQSQIENEGRLSKEMTIQKEIQEAQRKAKEAGRVLTEAETAEIRRQVGALYEMNAAKAEAKDDRKEAVAAEALVTAMMKQRAVLLREMRDAVASGDTEKQAMLAGEIDNINSELLTAIENAKAMWRAIGGPEATVALTNLNTAAMKIRQTAQEVTIDWQQIGRMFSGGLANAVDSFFQKVSEGEDAFTAAKDAFLQFAADFLRQIAQMLIQAAALAAFKSIMGAFGIPIPTMHSGGVVGGSVRSDARTVNPLMFAAAMRYHNGGIMGLAPNEVPIIAEKGEEMLTESDPRHRNNGGLAPGAAGSSANVKIINAIDAGSFVSEGVNTKEGEQAILNFVRSRKGTFKQILGG